MSIIKPTFPGQEIWPYLASSGLTYQTLQNSCARKGEVVGIDSRTAVSVVVDEVEYNNVPVWIHTDCGARKAYIMEQERELAEGYFDNAALMFPLPGGADTDAGPTMTPYVLVLIYTDPVTKIQSALCVFHILQNLFDSYESAHKTYRLYVMLQIDDEYDEASKYFLYDLVNDTVASIPYVDNNEPVMPFFDATGITDVPETEDETAQKDALLAFIGKGFSIPGAQIQGIERIGDFPVHVLPDPTPGYCFPEGGGFTTPGVDGTWDGQGDYSLGLDYPWSFEHLCYGGMETINFVEVNGVTTRTDTREFSVAAFAHRDFFAMMITPDSTEFDLGDGATWVAGFSPNTEHIGSSSISFMKRFAEGCTMYAETSVSAPHEWVTTEDEDGDTETSYTGSSLITQSLTFTINGVSQTVENIYSGSMSGTFDYPYYDGTYSMAHVQQVDIALCGHKKNFICSPQYLARGTIHGQSTTTGTQAEFTTTFGDITYTDAGLMVFDDAWINTSGFMDYFNAKISEEILAKTLEPYDTHPYHDYRHNGTFKKLEISMNLSLHFVPYDVREDLIAA